ncbi:MAG: MFS transporter [Chloroflexi bacterium]|nr:MFS transporter [Chloroflexota bacterium]
MSFVNAHFVTYARDLGYHPMAAAGAFSLIGAAAVIGSLFMGHLSDKYGRRWLLSASYNLRALGFVVVLLSMGVPALGIPPLGLGTLLAGVLLVGFSWNSVVSITAAYTSDRYGIVNLGTIYGTMFAVMPIGSGLGAFLGGLFYDLRGTYDIAIWSNIILLLVAMAFVSFRGERRPPELSAAGATA